MKFLILVGALGGPMMFARIGIMGAFSRSVERTFVPPTSIIIGND